MRWIMRVAMALVVFALILVAAVFLIPAEKIAGLAAREFSKITGRDLVISGSVRPSFYPVLGVKTGPVSIANAVWSDAGTLLSASSMEIAVDMASLMGGDMRITGLQVTDPVIVLERNADGLANWDFRAASGGGGTAGPDTPGAGTAFTLDLAGITGGTLRYTDQATGTSVELTDIDAEARIPDFNGAATLAGSAVLGGQAVALSGTIADFAAFLAGRLVPVTASARAGAAEVAFEGRVSTAPLAAVGTVNAGLADLAGLYSLAGRTPPAVPKGLGATSIAARGAVTLTPEGSVHLREATLTLDDNTLTGDLDLETAGDRPKLSAKLNAGKLVVGGGATSAGPTSDGGTSGAGGWSTDSIDVSALSSLDAVVALTAESLAVGGTVAGPVKVTLTLDRSRAVFDLDELAMFGGGISGQFVVNGRNGLSAGGDLTFASIALRPMLTTLAGYDRLSGTGDVGLKFLAVGNTMAALMQDLSGSGTLALTKGEVSGVDVPGILRTLDTSFVGEGAKTIYDAVTGSFTIEGGTLRNDDLSLAAPGLNATGGGVIGIGARDMTYRIRPTAVVIGGSEDGVAVPLLITGPWENLKFRLDLEAVAQEKLAEEAAELQARAEAALAEKLGIEAEEGENLKDAARRRLNEAIEDEAARALERLLGGGD